jgi:hypothetical protein
VEVFFTVEASKMLSIGLFMTVVSSAGSGESDCWLSYRVLAPAPMELPTPE